MYFLTIFSVLCILCLSSASITPLSSPFTGSATEGFEEYGNGQRSPTSIFGGQGSIIDSSCGWIWYSGGWGLIGALAVSHGGTQFWGHNCGSGTATITFSVPVTSFGGWFANGDDGVGLSLAFYDAHGFVASESISYSASGNNGHTIWAGYSSSTPITSIIVTGFYEIFDDLVIISGPTSVCGNGIVESGEQCDGGSCCTTTCTFSSSAAVCGTSSGPCDIAAQCTGSSATCPSNPFRLSSTVCRASAGPCDVAETCTGSSAACPTDSFQSSSVTCGAQTGPCDIAAQCSGSSAACPANSFQSSSTVCRAAVDVCDLAETCTGSSAACPADSFEPSGYTCRPSANSCDFAEYCTGSSTACPPDQVSNSVTCFCGRQGLTDGEDGYYCDATGGYYYCLGGAWAALSSDDICPFGTSCGCLFGQECSCGGIQSPCVDASSPGIPIQNCPSQ